MGHSNGVITAPINTDDVSSVLGHASHDVKTLCMSDKIKKYAKYKPVIIDTPVDITDAQRRAVNYGMNVRQTTLTQAKANTQMPWLYNAIGSTNWGRLTDFDGYDHNSDIPPIVFGFGFDSKEYLYNSVTMAATSIAVKVSFRRNASLASSGIGVVGLSLDDLGATGDTVESLNNYVPCVTAVVNSNLYVANAEDTFGGKFSTGVNDMAIVLDNFGFLTNCWVSDANGAGYPTDATDKYKMTLYPRINCFTPSAKGGVHTSLTTTKGSNGHYTSGTYPFLGVPDSTPLVIRKYKRAPVAATYSYFKDVSATATLAQGVYVKNTDAYTAQVGAWGGKTVYFKDRTTIIEMMVQLTNIENTAFSVQAIGITDTMGVWNKPCSITFKQPNGSYASTYALTKGASEWVTVKITYNAGCAASNYTFPSQTSPGYGQCQPKLSLRVIIANGTAEAFNPKEDVIREVRWR